mgnify:CR=1 FL=1
MMILFLLTFAKIMTLIILLSIQLSLPSHSLDRVWLAISKQAMNPVLTFELNCNLAKDGRDDQ